MWKALSNLSCFCLGQFELKHLKVKKFLRTLGNFLIWLVNLFFISLAMVIEPTMIESNRK